MATVSVIGASGYLGGELLRILSSHPSLELQHVYARSAVGRPVGDLYPNLARYRNLVIEADPTRSDSDLTFLALPAGEALAIVPGLLERGSKVVDLGPDYRLRDPSEFA